MQVFQQKATKMSNKEKKISQGPALDVHVYYENDRIQKVVIKSTPVKELQWQTYSSQKNDSLEERLANWFKAYVEGKEHTVSLPLNLESFTPFSLTVLSLIQQIPFSETKTYGEIAALAGSPGAARAVGSVCQKNPFPLLIPCHRVVGAKQTLVGYSGGCGTETKRDLLDFESKKGA